MEHEDHDQRIKTLIKAYFLEFMQLFFREWTELLDCREPEWLEQEAFPEPPDGPRRLMDLVAKVPTRKAIPNALDQEAVLAVVHIEIESQDSVGDIPHLKGYEESFRLAFRENLEALCARCRQKSSGYSRT